LSVCLSVSNFVQKHPNGFAWNFQGRLAVSKQLNFGGNLDTGIVLRIHHCWEIRKMSVFLYEYVSVWCYIECFVLLVCLLVHLFSVCFLCLFLLCKVCIWHGINKSQLTNLYIHELKCIHQRWWCVWQRRILRPAGRYRLGSKTSFLSAFRKTGQPQDLYSVAGFCHVQEKRVKIDERLLTHLFAKRAE